MAYISTLETCSNMDIDSCVSITTNYLHTMFTNVLLVPTIVVLMYNFATKTKHEKIMFIVLGVASFFFGLSALTFIFITIVSLPLLLVIATLEFFNALLIPNINNLELAQLTSGLPLFLKIGKYININQLVYIFVIYILESIFLYKIISIIFFYNFKIIKMLKTDKSKKNEPNNSR